MRPTLASWTFGTLSILIHVNRVFLYILLNDWWNETVYREAVAPSSPDFGCRQIAKIVRKIKVLNTICRHRLLAADEELNPF